MIAIVLKAGNAMKIRNIKMGFPGQPHPVAQVSKVVCDIQIISLRLAPIAENSARWRQQSSVELVSNRTALSHTPREIREANPLFCQLVDIRRPGVETRVGAAEAGPANVVS